MDILEWVKKKSRVEKEKGKNRKTADCLSTQKQTVLQYLL